jgi:hypothetical protein
LSPLQLPTLSPATSLPMPLPVLSPLPLHLLVCNKVGDGKGGKSNGNGNKEGDGNGGKRDGDGDKEDNGNVGKGNGNSN